MTTQAFAYEHTHDGTGSIHCGCGWTTTWDHHSKQPLADQLATQHAHLHTTPKGETLKP